MLRMTMVMLALAAPAPLAVTATGVGPVHAGVRVKRKNMAKLFPGYRAAEQADESEGEVVGHAVTLSKHGKPVLVVHGDVARKLVSVEVLSPDVAAPHGLRVGSRFSDLQKLGKLECARGMEEQSGELICRLAGEPRVAYLGEVEQLGKRWNGADDEVPPAPLVATMTIDRIAWTTP